MPRATLSTGRDSFLPAQHYLHHACTHSPDIFSVVIKKDGDFLINYEINGRFLNLNMNIFFSYLRFLTQGKGHIGKSGN
jgi:hypothetical protein